MNKVVIWVDEDARIWAPERLLLAGLGFQVLQIGDATTAYGVLVQTATTPPPELIILDVMLLQGDDQTLFSDELTNFGNETGLVLAEHVINARPEFAPRLLFFSRATRTSIVSKARELASRIGASFLQKGEATQGKRFVGWLRERGLVMEPKSK